jgi:hypothetical protein
VEFRNDTQMQNEVPNAGARSPNMSGLTEPEDPDYRVHAAWLAQASNAGDGPLPKEAAGGASELTSSLARPDRLGGQEAPLAPAQVGFWPHHEALNWLHIGNGHSRCHCHSTVSPDLARTDRRPD